MIKLSSKRETHKYYNFYLDKKVIEKIRYKAIKNNQKYSNIINEVLKEFAKTLPDPPEGFV